MIRTYGQVLTINAKNENVELLWFLVVLVYKSSLFRFWLRFRLNKKYSSFDFCKQVPAFLDTYLKTILFQIHKTLPIKSDKTLQIKVQNPYGFSGFCFFYFLVLVQISVTEQLGTPKLVIVKSNITTTERIKVWFQRIPNKQGRQILTIKQVYIFFKCKKGVIMDNISQGVESLWFQQFKI